MMKTLTDTKAMRLRIYIISVVALVGFSISGMACGIGGEDPKDYLLFRVFDSSINMIDWEVDQLEDSPDPEVQKYLKLARDCEKLRYFRDSKWYYPTKEVDVVHCSLEEVLAEALAYKGSKLRDRYALQAARAMFSLGKFREMREWWTKTEGRIKDEKIRKNIEGYVAGAMYRTGDEEKALEYYTSIGDISSIIYCLKNKGDYAGDRSLLEYAVVHCPDDPSIIAILQDYIRNLEVYADFHQRNGRVDACYKMCMNAVANSEDPAPWLYSAAFLKNQMGQPYVASNILARAERCAKTDFIKESIKVLRILIDAQVSTYNQAYERKLLDELKWLDGKIANNITDEVRKTTMEMTRLKYGFSYYYWNDMMRKIVIGTVVPRMIEAGKAPIALLLANYADNRLLSLVGEVEFSYSWQKPAIKMNLDDYRKKKNNSTDLSTIVNEYRSERGIFNNVDFSNHYFNLLDTISVSSVLGYEKLLMSYTSELETFLYKRSYINMEYLWDLIGTRYLRDCNYDKAVTYLSKVSDDYQKTLNTYYYMNRLPFSYDRRYGEFIPNYKLDFARKMSEYHMIASTCTDPDIVGDALIKIGIGMRNSLEFCWALTHYKWTYDDPRFELNGSSVWHAKAQRTLSKGLNSMTNKNACDVLANY
jgi:tetratricopeptide (TPR) repeat protein